MSRWLDRTDDLLYDGEEVVERVEIGDGGAVVTSHRVMAFTPEAEGANYEAVERPNVTGVEREAAGEFGYLELGIKAVVVGLVLVGAGLTVSLDSLVGSVSLSGGTGQLGIGGMLSLLQTTLDLLAMLDEFLTVAGALALLVGAAALGAYAWTREDVLVVEVAGDDDVEIPVPDAGSEDGDGGGDGLVPDLGAAQTREAIDGGGGAAGAAETDDTPETAEVADRLERAIRPGAPAEPPERRE